MNLKLWQQILIALVAGVLLGILIHFTGNESIPNFAKVLGTFFLNLIKMLIIPLIFFSLVVGITSIDSVGKIGRVATKTLILYMGTTAVAVVIGIICALAFKLGVGVNSLGAAIPDKIAKAPTSFDWTKTVLDLIPTNIVSAMSHASILQIIIFAIFLGIAVVATGAKAKAFKDFFDSGAEVIYTLTGMVMKFAPIGVFGIMTWAVAKYGPQIVGSLAMVIIVSYIASIIHAIVVYGTLVKLNGLSPVRFFKQVIDPAIFAFASTSSSGTLPISIATAKDKMGVSNSVASFVLPLGATINMDGTAIYQAVAAIFIAHAFGIPLTAVNYVQIVLLATLASIGTAGAPGAGLIMLSSMLVALKLPLEGVGLIFAIDRILDMARTTLNVVGDNMVALLIAKSENELDKDVFYSDH